MYTTPAATLATPPATGIMGTSYPREAIRVPHSKRRLVGGADDPTRRIVHDAVLSVLCQSHLASSTHSYGIAGASGPSLAYKSGMFDHDICFQAFNWLLRLKTPRGGDVATN